jgi:putative membrane protein
MRRILKHYLVDTLALYFIYRTFSGIYLHNYPQTLLLAGVGLMISSLLIKPLINVLLIPVNLVTFGLFRWVSSAITLYIVTLVVPGFSIQGFDFAGFSSKWLDIPAFALPQGILAFIAVSFLLSIITSLIYWLIK